MNKQGLSLNLTKVVKRFGDRAVIQNLDLTIKSGEFIAIVGRSGCGKSTLLRLLAQLDTITECSLNSDNLSAQELQSKTRLMFQDARLLPWKTVLENVGFGLKGKRQEKARQVLSEVGLLDRADDWPSTLSGGQRQRVSLARALIHQPQLLLLDEPLGALDALTRLEMQQLIVKLWKQHQFTIILVTHDVSEAILTSNRVLLVEEGKIDLDLAIKLPHPRQNVTETAPLEQKILQKILDLPRFEESYSI